MSPARAQNTGDDPAAFHAAHTRAIASLAKRGGASRWKLDEAVLAAAVERGVRSADVTAPDVDAFIDSLRAEDLVLAAACAAGIGAAWTHMVETLRPRLYSAARAIAGDDARGRELADSLWADLYGLEVRDGRRRSLLEYFHGRSSLLTWIRAVLAQRHVDSLRETSRRTPLDEAAEPPARGDDEPVEPGRARYVAMVGHALDAALAELDPRERTRLAYYYRHELSLKQVGRLMGEHESSVSRKLARTRDELKAKVDRALAEHLSRDEIEMCYHFAAGDLRLDLARALPEAK
jgi:RNA polymerase sigma-70 factor, ECF subfamily